MNLQTLKQIPLINRFLSETPDFWKQTRNIAIFAVALSFFIVNLPDLFEQFKLSIQINPLLIAICNKIIVIGATVGITAQATVKDVQTSTPVNN